MPSSQPRTPEVEIAEDVEAGFLVKIYDGEYLVRVRPHENGYQLSLASKTGLGDRAFLRTYSHEERFRKLLETEFDAIDEDAVFEVLEEHFDDEEYRIVNLKKGIKGFAGRGAYVYVETGETIPSLTESRDYRDEQWSKDASYRLHVWPTHDQWTKIEDVNSGERIADYRPNSLLEDIRNEKKDDHERERGPTSVPGVHAPVTVNTLDDAPVIHTHAECSHLEQLKDACFNPAGQRPPTVASDEFGELPLRWCLACSYREPTPDEIRREYSP